MTPGERFYPEEPRGPFPSPPREVVDAEGRAVTYRPLAWPGDEDAVTAMYREFDPADRAQGVPPVGEARIREWLATLSEGYNVLALHGDAVVGHATLVPDEDGGHELAIFVTQSHQGVGIGTELLRTLLGHGADHGVERVWLTVERWNRPAVALYESTGFETSAAESFELEMAIRLVAADEPEQAAADGDRHAN